MKIVYIGQYRDSSGCGVAARKYIRALDVYRQNSDEDFELRLYAPVAEKSNFHNNCQDLIDAFEFKSDSDIGSFIKDKYTVIWHIPSIMAVTSDFLFGTPPGCSPSLRKLILNAEVNIPLVAWETDSIPKVWTNLYDYYRPSKIIVPSEWSKEVMEKCVSGIPCDAIPHVIEETKKGGLEPVPFPGGVEDKFTILAMSQWNTRKGFDKLIRAYCAEFREHTDTVLVIKTYGNLVDAHSEELKAKENKFIIDSAKKYKQALIFDNETTVESGANIVIICDYLRKEQLNWVFDQADVSILLTRGEAFGLTVAESLMNEKPVIVPKEGGHRDYISPHSSFDVDGMWDMCMDMHRPYGVEGNWFECSHRSARDQMRNAYNLWKDNPSALKKMGEVGKKFILDNGYDHFSVGEALFNSIKTAVPRAPVILPAPLSNIKEKRKELLTQVREAKSLQQKVDILENSYEGETCYLFTCGPSVKNYPSEVLEEKLKDKLVFGVKRTLDYIPNCIDFHFFNCSNMPPSCGANNQEHYIYPPEERPIAIASSNYDLGLRWGKEQIADLFFKIPIRTSLVLNGVPGAAFLQHGKNFDDYLLSNTVERPCGPGIMFETVLYTAIHLGVKKIVAVGLDHTMFHPKDVRDYYHFYDKDTTMHNPGDMLSWELRDGTIAMNFLHKWLQERGVELTLCSDISVLSNRILRERI